MISGVSQEKMGDLARGLNKRYPETFRLKKPKMSPNPSHSGGVFTVVLGPKLLTEKHGKASTEDRKTTRGVEIIRK